MYLWQQCDVYRSLHYKFRFLTFFGPNEISQPCLNYMSTMTITVNRVDRVTVPTSVNNQLHLESKAGYCTYFSRLLKAHFVRFKDQVQLVVTCYELCIITTYTDNLPNASAALDRL